MDYLSIIRRPIDAELQDFISLFSDTLSHSDGMLQQVLDHIRQRAGKRMRPMLTILMAKCFGRVDSVTLHAAVGLELLHTASLVHDDVVDESGERRGQRSVNALYDNKIAVLVGDYILSTALLNVAKTENTDIVKYLSMLGQTLANGEILQLTNIDREDITYEAYYSIIKQKTAALFEACCSMGAMSAGAGEEQLMKAREFGQKLGIIFQIRDDIFDYYESSDIGKPTGNDMAEGKLTLPVIHALLTTRDDAMMQIAKKVKTHEVTKEEIAQLVAFTKSNGGIDYAKQKMEELREECAEFVENYVSDAQLKDSFYAYIDYVIGRNM